MFWNKPETLYTTQNPDLFITYKKGLICILVNVILLKYLKMNSMINSPLNSFLVNSFIIVTIDNDTYTVPSKKKYNILEDPNFNYSGILPPVLQPVKNPSQTNTMTGEFLRSHPIFKAKIFSLYMTPTICFCISARPQFPPLCCIRLKEQLYIWQNKHICFFPFHFIF